MGIIAKQGIKGTVVTYLGVAIGFITTFFVLTRFLTTEEVGLARVMIDAATLFVGLAQLGTTSSIIRFYPYFKDAPKDHGIFFFTLIIPLLGFALFAIVFLACHAPLSQWFGEKSPLFVHYYYLVLPMAFFLLYQSVFETSANVLMHIVMPRFVREVLTRIGLLAVYLLYAFRILSIDGFVWALCAVYAVCAFVDFIYMLTLGHISFRPDWAFLRANRPIINKYLLYTGFLIISSLTSVLAPTLSSFFITAQMGLNYTGIFAIATYMAVMVSIPYRSLTAIASPQLSQALKDNDQPQTQHLMQQCSNNLLLVGGFIFLIIWINIDLIYHILPNGQEYAIAKNVVFILAISQLLLSTLNISIQALNYSRYYAYSLLFSFILTAGALVLNNLLIPRYGMTGAALSNLLSYGIYFAFIILILALRLKVTLFSPSQLITLGLILIILVLNYLWLTYWPTQHIWLSSILRSILFLGSGAYLAYKLNISPELNALLHSPRIQRH